MLKWMNQQITTESLGTVSTNASLKLNWNSFHYQEKLIDWLTALFFVFFIFLHVVDEGKNHYSFNVFSYLHIKYH